MNEQSTTDPRTGLDKIFTALRGIGIRRRTDDKWIGGVASGLADRLGIDPVIVRAAFVLLTILGGVGVTFYLVAWALLPNDRDEIAAERAAVHGDAGSLVLLAIAGLAVLGEILGWGRDSGWWGFPWGLVVTGLLIWWLVQRSRNNPDVEQRMDAGQPGSPQQPGTPQATQPGTPHAAQSGTTYASAPSSTTPSPATPSPGAPRKLRRRSGGPLMTLVAIGLALVAYGILSWLGADLNWAGNHQTIALAGSLAAMGIVLVGLGLAGWRAGFLAFVTVVLAITAWSSTVVPAGIHLGGRMGDATWAPTSVLPDANYHLGAGTGILDLSALPAEGMSEVKLPAYVGLGELTVIVPDDLTVEVVGHVSLGEIALPGDVGSDSQGGTDLTRTMVIGEGPTEVVLDAGVGIGSLTVVKE